MYLEALQYLRCPQCAGRLAPQLSEIDATGDILTALLTCDGCGVQYPVQHGIGNFLGTPDPQTLAQQTNEWRLTAWAYERVWRPFSLSILSGERLPYQQELPLIADWAEVAHGGLFLDVACSNGLYARALAQRMVGISGHVIGIDHAQPMVLAARQRARTAGLRISYLRATAQALPIVSEAACGVTIGGSLNEIGDLDTCLREARRVLGNDGRLVVMALVAAQTAFGRFLQRAFATGGVVFLGKAALLEHFRQHGFAVAKQQSHGIVIFVQNLAQ